MRNSLLLFLSIAFLSCNSNSVTENTPEKTNATDCCAELENAKNELRTTQLEIELLRLQLVAMEDSIARISQKP
jgi:hypothetical protein